MVNRISGSVAALVDISLRLAGGVPPARVLEWLRSGRYPAAFDPRGRPLGATAPERRGFDLAVAEFSDDLIAYLAANPEQIYTLTPRRFEELVAELYRRRGFEATLTPASGDQGVDIYVVRRDDLGTSLTVVQAKRYAPNRKVGASVVRELVGTVDLQRASTGVLITTSGFEPGARRVEEQYRYRLALRDYVGLQELLRAPTGRSAER